MTITTRKAAIDAPSSTHKTRETRQSYSLYAKNVKFRYQSDMFSTPFPASFHSLPLHTRHSAHRSPADPTIEVPHLATHLHENSMRLDFFTLHFHIKLGRRANGQKTLSAR